MSRIRSGSNAGGSGGASRMPRKKSQPNSNSNNSNERFESRFKSMKLGKGGGEEEIYNAMVNKLSRAIENGDIEGDMDDSLASHREQAHVLLHKATSKLAGGSAGGGRKKTDLKDHRPSSKSHSRQQAADRAKASDGVVDHKNKSRQSSRGGRRQSHRSNDDYYDDDESDEYASESDEEGDSDTEYEINTTKALLEEAAARLGGGSNLDTGIYNVIYASLMDELGVKPANSNNHAAPQKQTSRAQQRAAAAAGFLPSSSATSSSNNDPSSVAAMRARREMAATMFMNNDANAEQQQSAMIAPVGPSMLLPTKLASPSDGNSRRKSAKEILQSLQDKQHLLKGARGISESHLTSIDGESGGGREKKSLTQSASALNAGPLNPRRAHASSSSHKTGASATSSSSRSRESRPERHKSDPNKKESSSRTSRHSTKR